MFIIIHSSRHKPSCTGRAQEATREARVHPDRKRSEPSPCERSKPTVPPIPDPFLSRSQTVGRSNRYSFTHSAIPLVYRTHQRQSVAPRPDTPKTECPPSSRIEKPRPAKTQHKPKSKPPPTRPLHHDWMSAKSPTACVRVSIITRQTPHSPSHPPLPGLPSRPEERPSAAQSRSSRS